MEASGQLHASAALSLGEVAPTPPKKYTEYEEVYHL
jgi:hypothetical protein